MRAQVWLACITQNARPQKNPMFLTILSPNVGGCRIVPKNDLKCIFLIEMSIGPHRNSKSDFGSLKPTSSDHKNPTSSNLIGLYQTNSSPLQKQTNTSPQKPCELKFDWPVSHFPPPPPPHAVQTSMLHCNQLEPTKTLRAQVWLACITLSPPPPCSPN